MASFKLLSLARFQRSAMSKRRLWKYPLSFLFVLAARRRQQLVVTSHTSSDLSAIHFVAVCI